MNLVELFLTAVGLSMDAFAVALSTGITLKKGKVLLKQSILIGLYFGIFQAVMPLTGYLLGSRFADEISAFDHWTAFIMLGFIGGKMLIESLKKEKESEPELSVISIKHSKLFLLAIATSIDALAAGISFAFLKISILPAVLLIGIVTFLLSVTGVQIGNVFGLKLKSRAEFLGGLILVLIGLKILLEHTL